jgi:hypothetical protein
VVEGVILLSLSGESAGNTVTGGRTWPLSHRRSTHHHSVAERQVILSTLEY